jgi:peptide chain release factor 3
VFKVQANMDRNHRDRIAFARICSGRFDRGMVMTCGRTGKPFATKYASTVFGAERTTIDEAFPGDVVGLVNATGLNIGDTLYDEIGPPVEFPAIPQFAPEVFATARPADTGKSKQFRKGLDQLGEEGVVQVLRDPDWGDASPVLAAVGQLQFDVFANRLDIEFNAPIELASAPYQAIRLTDAGSADELREKVGVRILARNDGALVALFENKYALARIEQNEPDLTLDHIIAG